MSLVLTEKHDGYAIITLNRPQEMNALSRELRRQFVQAFEDCSGDESTRVVILTGNGAAFCAGFDLKELGTGGPPGPDTTEEVDNAMARAMELFCGPIIGAINGHAITGGFEMALACDVLLASDNARFADTHARVGILPGWGLSQKLPRLIGLARAKELSFSGSPIDARQAYEWGLVNHVYPAAELLPRAIAMAEAMCRCVPGMLIQYKSLIDEGYSMPLNEALAWEEEKAIASARKAFSSIIEKRRDTVLQQGRRDKNRPEG